MSETKSAEQIIQLDEGLYFGEISPSGLRHGKGLMLSRANVFFQGRWVLDCMEGPGLERGAAHEYRGGFAQGKRSGFGEFFCALTREWYSGMWARGRRHGPGKILYPNGDVFDGIFKSGKKSGFGVKVKAGVRHQGIYLDGAKHGIFVFQRKRPEKTFYVWYERGRVSRVKTKKGYKKMRAQNLIEGALGAFNFPKRAPLPERASRLQKREKRKSVFSGMQTQISESREPSCATADFGGAESRAESRPNQRTSLEIPFEKASNARARREAPGPGNTGERPLEALPERKRVWNNVFLNAITFSSTVDSLRSGLI